MEPSQAHIPLAIAVLAGGQSTRMGSDKSFALLNGRPLIEHTIDKLETLRRTYPTAPILIISNNVAVYSYLGLPVLTDVLPHRASLSGLYSALWHSPAQFTLCVACDMPFLNPALLEYLIQAAEGWEAAIPRIGDHLETLHAVYSKSCLNPIRGALDRRELKITKAVTSLQTNYIDVPALRRLDPELHSFRNINTHDDLARANRDV